LHVKLGHSPAHAFDEKLAQDLVPLANRANEYARFFDNMQFSWRSREYARLAVRSECGLKLVAKSNLPTFTSLPAGRIALGLAVRVGMSAMRKISSAKELKRNF
jgi:hypothetical protein